MIPVRDTSYERDKRLFEDLGIFDVLGYADFQGSGRLTAVVQSKQNSSPIKLAPGTLSRDQPTYVIKTPYDLDGNTRMLAAIKKSALYRFRSFDPTETPRLSVYDAYRQVSSSYGVVSHMIDPSRRNADSHNGLCAFVSGMALALGKRVLMLQEGYVSQPIDYRALIVPYKEVRAVTSTIENFVREVADAMNGAEQTNQKPVHGMLEKIDLGDTAAENEIRTLTSYFVKTPQYQQARTGHARLVVGRKGSGKTAIFYGVRSHVSSSRSIVLDLKPEGHHFTKLREQVLVQMTQGVQLHTLTAFWSYLLMLELAKKIIDKESVTAWQDAKSLESHQKLKAEYDAHCLDAEGDFSERIMSLVNSMTAAIPEKSGGVFTTAEITKMVYHRDVAPLMNMVLSHLEKKDCVWMLFDNIDKGWTGSGATEADIAIVRSLLDATRKLQRDLDRHQVEFNSIVFLRKDICDLLVDQTPDRGKESVASLDWSDQALLEEMLLRRFRRSHEFTGDFRYVWAMLFAPHVGGEDSFRYILCRAMHQPRAVLNFVTKCIQVAVGHDHLRVEESDILTAEKAFSEDMLNSVRFEIRDVFPSYRDILHSFLGYTKELNEDDIRLAMIDAELEIEDVSPVVDALLWFSFLGIRTADEVRYSYDLAYDVEKLKMMQKSIEATHRRYVIHPAFHLALSIK